MEGNVNKPSALTAVEVKGSESLPINMSESNKTLVNIYQVSADTIYLFIYDFWLSVQYGKFSNASWDMWDACS